ncbi:MAG: formyltransferase family protein [Planctomycetota bacterium]
MRLIVLTSIDRGFASICLPALVEHPSCEVKAVVLAGAAPVSRRRRLQRKLRKTLRIGPLGALNGIRMRRWFNEDVADLLQLRPIEDVARELDVALERTASVNCDRTVELFERSGAELGLSLGNSYIAQRVFTTLEHGMLNVHHEQLPRFRGAQSVIWQIYHGSNETGYTVHRLSAEIDAGDILLRETLPIDLRPTLRETVSATVASLYRASAGALPDVCARFPELAKNAEHQTEGERYTTPSYWQYRRMKREHERAISR